MSDTSSLFTLAGRGFFSACRHGACVTLFMCMLAACSGRDTDAPPESAAIELPPVPVVAFDRFGNETKEQFASIQERLTNSPRDGHYNAQFARLLHAYELYAPAAVMYRRCSLLRKSDLECQYLEALIHRQLGDNARALNLLTKLFDRKPDFPRVATVLADTYRQQGQYEKAIPLFERALKNNRRNKEATYGLAMSLLDQGKLDQAEELLQSLHADGSHYGIVYAGLANVYRQQGSADKVEFNVAAASRFASSKIPFIDAVLWDVQDQLAGDAALVRDARALFAKGQLHEAANMYSEAVVLNPANASTHISLITVYGQLGNMVDAQRHFERARELNSNNIDPLMAMGRIQMKRGGFQQAQDLFASVLELRPSSAEARTYRTYCSLLLGGSIDPAELRQALSDDPTQSLAHYLLGRHLAATKNCESALPHLQSSIRIENAQTPAFVPELVACLVNTGQHDSVESYLTRGRELAVHYKNSVALKAIDQVAAKIASTSSGD